MSTRYSYIFGITTEAADREAASPHSGSWTESFHFVNVAGFPSWVLNLGRARAAMLPRQAAIIGIRRLEFTIAGNQIVKGGTSAIKVRFPGPNAYDCDLPQVAVQMSLGGALGNTSRATLRGIPDAIMVKGEYQPDFSFKQKMADFCKLLVDDDWQILGRDLSLPTGRIVTISALGVATLRGSIGAVEGDYVRLLRVRDLEGKERHGVYRVTTEADGGETLTLRNWPAGVSVVEVGSLRVDKARLDNIDVASASRAVVRKIGSPSERYRGRSSKKRR